MINDNFLCYCYLNIATVQILSIILIFSCKAYLNCVLVSVVFGLVAAMVPVPLMSYNMNMPDKGDTSSLIIFNSPSVSEACICPKNNFFLIACKDKNLFIQI